MPRAVRLDRDVAEVAGVTHRVHGPGVLHPARIEVPSGRGGVGCGAVPFLVEMDPVCPGCGVLDVHFDPDAAP